MAASLACYTAAGGWPLGLRSAVAMSPAEAFEEYHGYMLHAATRWTRDADRAADLVQSMWVQAIPRWDAFRGDASRKTWLYVILRRRFLEQLKRQRCERAAFDFVPTDAVVPPKFAVDLEHNDTIRDVLEKMRPGQRESLLAWANREYGQDTQNGAKKLRAFRAIQNARKLV